MHFTVKTDIKIFESLVVKHSSIDRKNDTTKTIVLISVE